MTLTLVPKKKVLPRNPEALSHTIQKLWQMLEQTRTETDREGKNLDFRMVQSEGVCT